MFPKILKQLRTKKNLTQQNMADFLGITRQGYAKYENSDSEPSFEILQKIADYFGETTDYLLTGRNVASLPDNLQHYFDNSVRGQIELKIPIGTTILLNSNFIIKTSSEHSLKDVIKEYFGHIQGFYSNDLNIFYDEGMGVLNFTNRNLKLENLPKRKPNPEFVSSRLLNLIEHTLYEVSQIPNLIGISVETFNELLKTTNMYPSKEVLEKLSNFFNISIDYLLGIEDAGNSTKNVSVAGQEITLSIEELRLFNELKKHPIMFHDLATDPEAKVKELIKLYKMKKMFLEDDTTEYGDGFGELED